MFINCGKDKGIMKQGRKGTKEQQRGGLIQCDNFAEVWISRNSWGECCRKWNEIISDFFFSEFKFRVILICVVLLFLLIDYSHAQRFKGGIVGGFNFSQIDGDDMVGYNKFGLNGGGYVATVLSDRWLISTELLFSQRGSRLSSTEPIIGIFDRIKLDFLEVPVLINFKEWKFHVQAGVSYARLFDSQIIEISGADITDTIDLNEDLISIVLGGTFFFTEKWGLNIQWHRAFNDLQVDKTNKSWFSKSVTIRALYLFN